MVYLAVKAEYINDDKISRVMDALHDHSKEMEMSLQTGEPVKSQNSLLFFKIVLFWDIADKQLLLLWI